MFLIKAKSISAIFSTLAGLNIDQHVQERTVRELEKFALDLMVIFNEFQSASGYHHIQEAFWFKHLHRFVDMYRVDRELRDLVSVTTELTLAYIDMVSDNTDVEELDTLLTGEDKPLKLTMPDLPTTWRPKSLTAQALAKLKSERSANIPLDSDIIAMYPDLLYSDEGYGRYSKIVEAALGHTLNNPPIRRHKMVLYRTTMNRCTDISKAASTSQELLDATFYQ